MKNIAELDPKVVFSIFNDILEVPRPSKKEERIREFIKNFANTHHLPCKQDECGNLVITKQASAGYENERGVVLQSHMDMVCEKDADKVFDFEHDSIEAYVEEGWVKARGTTLGADCGIGMALQMAVLVSQELKHPKIEALFTVDEEQGLTGATKLGTDMLTGQWLINLDSEDEGEIFIGCAGGVDTLATFDIEWQKVEPQGMATCRVEVSGLKGGHSGDDINKGLACANKLLTRVLWAFKKECPTMKIAAIDGGNLRNAIARHAWAEIVIPQDKINKTQEIFDLTYKGIVQEFGTVETELSMDFKKLDTMAQKAIPEDVTGRVVAALEGVYHGVVAMSRSMEGLVETSTNLASIKIVENSLIVTTSQRSSVEDAKWDIAHSVEAVFALAGAQVVHSEGYNGWMPNPKSLLTQKAAEVYNKIFSKPPKVKAIHAGLECGLILGKYPKMDAISIGPTLRGVHSPSERLDIDTVKMVWRYLTELLSVR